MSIASRLKSAVTAFRFDSTTDLTKLGGNYFIPIAGGSMSLYNDLQYDRDFNEIPELNAVISRKARMWGKMQLRIVSKETGKDAKNYEYLIKVLRNPNWYQAQKEWLFQTKLFREIHGNEYLYFDKPFGQPFRTVKSLYSLPPANMIVKTPQELPFYMYDNPEIDYKFQWGNNTYQLINNAVIQFNDGRVTMNRDNWTQGVSKMEALKLPINNIRAAYESRNMIIRYRGATGFISPDSKDAAGVLPLGDSEKKNMQGAWREYGTGRDQWQFVFSPSPVKFVSVGVNDPSKLGLFTEIEADFMKVCDSYGMDRDMFGNEKGATWENKKQGERATWNNTIIPEALEWVDGLNDVFDTYKESWRIIADFVDIPVLQENIAEKGQAIRQITDSLSIMLADKIITPEDYQRELNKLGFELTELPPQSVAQ
jgi:hypothetical protein